MQNNKLVIILTISSLLLISCKSNKFDIDISSVQVEVKIKRFEKELFSYHPDSIYQKIPAFQKEYGHFFDLWNVEVAKIGPVSEKNYKSHLKEFMFYCASHQIPSDVDKVFSNLDSINNELNAAFKHFKYYFPGNPVPQIYTFISAFNQSVITDKNLIGISLDKYLGIEYPNYKRLGWDKYLRSKMHKKMIPVDCMRALAIMEFPYNDSIDNLLSNIIYEGKIQYFLDAMLPGISDTLKWAYSSKQLDWAKRNENHIWEYFVEKKLLFGSDQLEIGKLVKDAPFTISFSNISAPRAGTWVGYKIVHSYMDNHPDIKLAGLMKENNYQKILNFAKYNP